MVALRLGLRNLARNRWRSGLTLGAVAVAVGLMVWILAMNEGWMAAMVRGVTAVGTGQVQVHAAGYIETPRVYETFPAGPGLLDRIRSIPDVRAVAPRIEAHGLVGNEQRSQVARVIGVDPRLEAAVTPIEGAVVEGRWLAPVPPAYPAPREVVLGSGVARQLRVAPGDELVVFLEAADGSLGNELLRVVGVVRTANTQIDRLAAYMRIDDARFLTALGANDVHELVLRTADLDAARDIAAAVAAAIGARVGLAEGDGVGGAADMGGAGSASGAGGAGGASGASSAGNADGGGASGGAVSTGRAGATPPAAAGLVVRPWQEVVPAIHQMVTIFRSSSWFMYVLVYLIAAVGIVNTARMSALERRREFGIMLAIGMRPRRMFRTIVAETVVLGSLGAVIGALGGLLLSGYFAAAGLDLRAFTDEATFSVMGVGFSERIYFVLTAGNVIEPVVVMLAVALLSALWPAVQAARIDPAPTIAGRS